MKVKVLFGETEVHQFVETGKVPKNACVIEHTFSTDAEYDAYFLGLDEAVGWMEYTIVEQRRTKKGGQNAHGNQSFGLRKRQRKCL